MAATTSLGGESALGDGPGEGHLSPLTMARLRSGQLEAEAIVRDVVPHLASHCPECRAAAEAVERLKRQVGHWDEVVAVIEGTEAPELWRRLEGLGYAEQLRAVETEATFQTWGLCRLLLGMSREAVEEAALGTGTRALDGGKVALGAVRLANLAVRIAGQLGAAYHPEWVLGCWFLMAAYCRISGVEGSFIRAAFGGL